MRIPTIMLCTAIVVSPVGAAAQPTLLAVPAPVAAAADAGAPVQKTAEQNAADRASEVICKREAQIASLVKSRKTCHTRAQWDYIASENQRLGRDLVQANTGRPPGQ